MALRPDSTRRPPGGVGRWATGLPWSVIVVAFPDVQALDVVGPLEVFAMANRYGADPAYANALRVRFGEPVTTSSGLSLGTERASRREAIDTLLVAGGTGTAAAMADERLIAWLRAAGECPPGHLGGSGAFLLAQAGLLDGRRVTTHWSACDTLARLFPAVEVDADPIYVRDGNVWTSAGVTAGMDLALALVEHDNGGEVALAVARQLVLFTHRPGGQSQFSASWPCGGPSTSRSATRWRSWPSIPRRTCRCRRWPGGGAMSVRTFARAFSREVGTTPAACSGRGSRPPADCSRMTDGTVDDTPEPAASAPSRPCTAPSMRGAHQPRPVPAAVRRPGLTATRRHDPMLITIPIYDRHGARRGRTYEEPLLTAGRRGRSSPSRPALCGPTPKP